MADLINISSIGTQEISKVLKDLPQAMTRKVLLAAQRDAVKPVVKSMKMKLASQVSSQSGNLMKSIGTKALKSSGITDATITGPRVGGRFKGYHAHLIEKGTKPGLRKTKGTFSVQNKDGDTFNVRVIRHPGTKAKPFAEPAIKENLPTVQENLERSLAKVLLRTMNRTIKKASA